MAKNLKTSAAEKRRDPSPDADTSATTSDFDIKKIAGQAVENLKWWREHPEEAAAHEREKFLDELEIEPYIPTEEESGDESK